jgi:DNA repair exonuclease SbcCD ATPase subunit
MLKFKTVRWRNFLSTGNEFTEILLDRSPTTLIVGSNGAGKSTLLDALSFGLFGKAHRDINKMQLVNSINQKGTLVEVEFSVSSHDFKIVRGIKPTKFEIWQNGNMINQSAAARDYQKFLEQNILKLNHKSFHQIVVLGSSSFIPFMQLPAHTRREVIEDLLDIQIFGRMNGIIKEKLSKLKEEITSVGHSVDLTKEKLVMQKKYIKDITEINDAQLRQKSDQIQSLESDIADIQLNNSELTGLVTKNQDGLEEKINSISKKRNSILQYEAQFKQQINYVVKDAKFYEDNQSCPTCTQVITDSIRKAKLQEAQDKAKELNTAMEMTSKQSLELEESLKSFNEIAKNVHQWNTQIHSNNNSINQLQKQIKTIKKEIDSISGKSGDLSKANELHQELVEERDSLTEKKLRLLEARTYSEAAYEMLKDTGIKTKIIKEYLPAMNTLINKYLNVLDFFVSFHLDENFNETIKSRHRDDFKYTSFSEGEKQRVDLALLFAWRQIAKMKNSSSTNLLILDETFDSSLDQDGVENLMKILGTLDNDTNVFVISHKGDILDGKFRSKIEFTKDRNFSQMVKAKN